MRAPSAGTTLGIHAGHFALGLVGMGRVQQQFFPDSKPARGDGGSVVPEGTPFAANEE